MQSQLQGVGRAVLLVALGSFSGCFPVFSVYPLYTESDKVWEPSLVGAWSDTTTADPGWIFSAGEGLNYRISIQMDSTGAMDTTLVGRLVRLRDALFLDLYAGGVELDSAQQACLPLRCAFWLQVPTHMIFRVECTDSTLDLWNVDDKWFPERGKPKSRSVRYVEIDGVPVLTGTTEEVRAFVSKHWKDEGLFTEYGSYVRCSRKPSIPTGG